MVELKQHQIKAYEACYDKLKKYGLVYLFGEPRSGKTLTALEIARNFCYRNNKKTILVLTKKNAIIGWEKQIKEYSYNLEGLDIIVKNYEQVKNVGRLPDIYIQDESHNLGRVGKSTIRYKRIKSLCWNAPLIMLSGTPLVENIGAIYYQSTTSKYSPFSKFKTFFDFFRFYGIPNQKRIGLRFIETYTEYKPGLKDEIDKLVVILSLKDAGHFFENVDKIHYIEPLVCFKQAVKRVLRDRMYKNIPLDTITKLRTFLHLYESGLYYVDDNSRQWKDIPTYSCRKIDYLLENFNDGSKVAIMCYFKAEQEYLKQRLGGIKHFEIFSSSADCEGVDLSHFDKLVIFSQDYSGAKFIQRRNRIVNLENKKDTEVHYLIFKGGISEQVFECVSKKKTFNDKMFNKDLFNEISI